MRAKVRLWVKVGLALGKGEVWCTRLLRTRARGKIRGGGQGPVEARTRGSTPRRVKAPHAGIDHRIAGCALAPGLVRVRVRVRVRVPW